MVQVNCGMGKQRKQKKTKKHKSMKTCFILFCFAWSPARGNTDHGETKDYDKSHWVNSMAGK